LFDIDKNKLKNPDLVLLWNLWEDFRGGYESIQYDKYMKLLDDYKISSPKEKELDSWWRFMIDIYFPEYYDMVVEGYGLDVGGFPQIVAYNPDSLSVHGYRELV